MTEQDKIDRDRQALIAIGESLRGECKPICVMVVDDSSQDAELTAAKLEARGLVVRVVNTGEAALQSISGDGVFVIFLDMKLPRMSGLSVLMAIKAMPIKHKVIILTGAHDKDAVECKEALRLGAEAIMLKPLTDEQVSLIFTSPL